MNHKECMRLTDSSCHTFRIQYNVCTEAVLPPGFFLPTTKNNRDIRYRPFHHMETPITGNLCPVVSYNLDLTEIFLDLRCSLRVFLSNPPFSPFSFWEVRPSLGSEVLSAYSRSLSHLFFIVLFSINLLQS